MVSGVQSANVSVATIDKTIQEKGEFYDTSGPDIRNEESFIKTNYR